MGEVSVRLASPRDLDAIVGIAQACFGLSAWGAAHFSPHPARTVFVAENDSSGCVGYSVLESLLEQAELQAIAVMPPFRCQGVGQALLLRALSAAAANGASAMFLEVRQSNLKAQTFYRRFGFDVCGTRPAYYRLPEEAAVVMRRNLNDVSGVESSHRVFNL